MDDKEAIQDAYSDQLQQLFKFLHANYTLANGDPHLQAQALSTFQAGLALARKVRADALSVL